MPDLQISGLDKGSLAAQVLDFMVSQTLGLLELAAAADVIAADCRANWWIYSEVKPLGLEDERFLQLLGRLEEADELALKAMHAFTVDRRSDRLLKAFEDVVDRLNDRSLPGSSPPAA